MAEFIDPSDALLTASDVRERVTEFHAWEAQVEELNKKMDERRDWFALVAKLLGPDMAKALLGDLALSAAQVLPAETTRRTRHGQITWTAFIEDYVKSVNRPVDYGELREAISKSVLGNKLAASDKGFYGAILKLTERGVIRKKGQLVFNQDAFDDYERKVAEGLIDEKLEKMRSRPAPLEGEVMNFLATRPSGATSKEIIAHMSSVPEFSASVTRNTTTVYNALTRMLRRELIRKIGQTYYSPYASAEETAAPIKDAAV